MTGSAIVVRGNALQLPLPDESVDLIVTSPPFFSQRVYKDGGFAYDGQIGNEPHPQDFLESLWKVMKECWRVLKPEGMCVVNLGDKHTGSGGANNATLSRAGARGGPSQYSRKGFGRRRSKMLLPHRFAIGCEDGLADPDGIGWVVHQDLVWSKPNSVPDSTPDRPADAHEFWFMMTKLETGFFSAMDLLREPQAPSTLARAQPHRSDSTLGRQRGFPGSARTQSRIHLNALGSAPRSWWSISSEPLVVPDELGFEDHYAAFPSEWPRRLILGWSPEGVCTQCDRGRFPVVSRPGRSGSDNNTMSRTVSRLRNSIDGGEQRWVARTSVPDLLVGFACACTPRTDHPGSESPSPTASDNGRQGDRPVDIGRHHRRVGPWCEYHLEGWDAPPTRPAVVLDPFGGTGTTAMVAKTLGRVGISVDLSHDYCRLARWRIFESGHDLKVIARTEGDIAAKGEAKRREQAAAGQGSLSLEGAG